MRWLLRFIIFWAISAPISYFYGIPALLDYMTNKVRTDGYAQCMTHMSSEKLVGGENAPFTAQQGEKYCHCISDSLTFTKADLFEMIPKNKEEFGKPKQPTALTAQAEALSQKCNAELQQSQSIVPPVAAPAASGNEPIFIE